ncbi:hypothetical protein PAXRUDRAFT_27878, partial [Paxillus rubicundulus Ve08.2h10]
MSLNTTEHHTHAANATSHPSAILLEAQGKWHTKVEIAADNEAQCQAQAMSDLVSMQVLMWIATLEAKMEAKKVQALSSKPLATHPKPRDPVAADSTTSADMGSFNKDPSEDKVDNGTQKRAVRWLVKLTFRERVKDAHNKLDQPLNNGHEDKKSPGSTSTTGCSQVTGKGNLVATKAALPRLVKNWASAVVLSTCASVRPEPSHTASTHVPLSVSSKGLSMKTHTTSKSSLALPQTLTNSVMNLSHPPIGGLGEGDSEDDIYEGPVGIGAKADIWGKSMRK